MSIPIAENYMAESSLRVTWLEMGYKLRLGGSEKARALFIARMAGAWFSALTEGRQWPWGSQTALTAFSVWHRKPLVILQRIHLHSNTILQRIVT